MSKNSKKKHGCSGFVFKLMEILSDEKCEDFIEWHGQGNMFKITNTIGFIQKTLPKYFKHQNFASFIRQLNMYGFRKSKEPQDENSWFHEHFIRGSKTQLNKIKRQNVQRPSKDSEYLSEGNSDFVAKSDSQFGELKLTQNILEQKCKKLMLQNQMLVRKNRQMEKNLKIIEKKKQSMFQKLSQVMANPLNLPYNHIISDNNENLCKKLNDNKGNQENFAISDERRKQKSQNTSLPVENIFQNEEQAISQLFQDLNEKLFNQFEKSQ